MKLADHQLVLIFCVSFGTERVITVFARRLVPSLSQPRLMQSAYSVLIPLKPIFSLIRMTNGHGDCKVRIKIRKKAAVLLYYIGF